MKTFIAIDPGASGGIAVECPDGKRMTFAMPDTESELLEILRDMKSLAAGFDSIPEACLEKVGGFVKGDESRPNRQPGHTMFTFGRGVGVAVGILMGLGVSFREVRPQEWQKSVGAGTTNGRNKTEWKRHLKDIAQKRNPGIKITLKTSDAVLMLDWLKGHQ